MPDMSRPLAALGPGECQVTVRERAGPQSAWVSLSTNSAVMVSSRLAANVPGGTAVGQGRRLDGMVQTPCRQRVQNGEQIPARLGQVVVEPWRRRLAGPG